MIRAETFLSGLSVGLSCFGGGLWFVVNSGLRRVLAHLDDRRAMAVLLALAVSLLLAGFPAGMVAEEKARASNVSVLDLASAFGSLVLPIAARFAGLHPAWPASWAWAWGLAFAGSWAGLAAGLLLGRRKK